MTSQNPAKLAYEQLDLAWNKIMDSRQGVPASAKPPLLAALSLIEKAIGELLEAHPEIEGARFYYGVTGQIVKFDARTQ